MDSVRVDKWLWSVRLYKSRTKANKACKSGDVFVNDVKAKPSQDISTGDIVLFKKDGFNLSFRVLKLIKKRVGYPIAKECYEDLTPEDEYNKYKDWHVGKGTAEIREKGAGRPTKKERRELEEFKRRLWR